MKLISPLSKSNKGQSTLFFLIFTMVILSICSLALYKQLLSYKVFHFRKKIILCHKELESRGISQLKMMGKMNRIILTAHKISFFPPARPYALKTKKISQIVQQTLYISKLKKVLSSSYCPLKNELLFIKNLPWKTKMKSILVRGQDGTAKIKGRKWEHQTLGLISFYPSKSFLIKSKWNVETRLSLEAEIIRKEFSLKKDISF